MIPVGCLFSRWELAMQAGDQPCSHAPLFSYRSETRMLLPSLGLSKLETEVHLDYSADCSRVVL